MMYVTRMPYVSKLKLSFSPPRCRRAPSPPPRTNYSTLCGPAFPFQEQRCQMPGLGNNKNTKCWEFDGCNISSRKRAKAFACCLMSPAQKVSVEVESRRETAMFGGYMSPHRRYVQYFGYFLYCTHPRHTNNSIVGAGKERHTSIGPWGNP